MAEELKCDVCGQPGVGVASSSFGPISFAYCSECINKPAEPLFIFYYLFDEVGTNGDGLAEQVNQWFTWQNGEYVSWPDFRKAEREKKGIVDA